MSRIKRTLLRSTNGCLEEEIDQVEKICKANEYNMKYEMEDSCYYDIPNFKLFILTCSRYMENVKLMIYKSSIVMELVIPGEINSFARTIINKVDNITYTTTYLSDKRRGSIYKNVIRYDNESNNTDFYVKYYDYETLRSNGIDASDIIKFLNLDIEELITPTLSAYEDESCEMDFYSNIYSDILLNNLLQNREIPKKKKLGFKSWNLFK